MVSEDFIAKNLSRDKKQFYEDLELSPLEILNNENETPIIADFTEYSPLHNGHLYCMKQAQKQHPEALFVAVVPGLFDRNGRGLPYILTRQKRAELAIQVGADIVVEGPPMGILGSGQYSLLLASMFKALNTDYIPRGYIRDDAKFKIILDTINRGVGVAPKPYKIVNMQDKKVLLEGKLENDDYVIVSLSKSLTKVNFDFKNKFIFIPRLENVSGTLIRKKIATNDFNEVSDMLPQATIDILKEEISNDHAPLDSIRSEKSLLSNVNNMKFEDLLELTLIDQQTVENIVNNRPFNSINEVFENITPGFSTHRKQRILSVLETGIFKYEVHKYISNYPQIIRILGYKNEDVLNKFIVNIRNNLKGDHEIICQ